MYIILGNYVSVKVILGHEYIILGLVLKLTRGLRKGFHVYYRGLVFFH